MIRVACRGLTAGIALAATWMAWLTANDIAHNLAHALTDTDHFTEEDDE